MPSTTPHDDLEDYLRGGSALSRQYRRDSALVPPHVLDRRVLDMSRGTHSKSPCLAPLAFAASVLLSVALVLAILVGPPSAKRADDAPRVVKVAVRADVRQHLYSSDPHLRLPAVWLADIAALRRAGRNGEADAELHRFQSAYPEYSTGEVPLRH
jgi:hypothetical protein